MSTITINAQFLLAYAIPMVCLCSKKLLKKFWEQPHNQFDKGGKCHLYDLQMSRTIIIMHCCLSLLMSWFHNEVATLYILVQWVHTIYIYIYIFTFAFITDPSICSSSISSYMSTKWAATCHECYIKASSHTYRYLEVPLIRHQNTEDTDAACGFIKFFEWLGAANEQLNW